MKSNYVTPSFHIYELNDDMDLLTASELPAVDDNDMNAEGIL